MKFCDDCSFFEEREIRFKDLGFCNKEKKPILVGRYVSNKCEEYCRRIENVD